MKPFHLNSIAARIALTVVFAILLGFSLEFLGVIGWAYLRFWSTPNHHITDRPQITFSPAGLGVLTRAAPRSPQILAAQVVAIAQIVESTPEAERARVTAAVSQPSLQVTLRDAPLPNLSNEAHGRLRQIRHIVQYLLGDPPREVIIASRPQVSDCPERDSSQQCAPGSEGRAILIEVSLVDDRWLTFSTIGSEGFGYGLVLMIGILCLVVGSVSVAAARRLATPITAFATAAERRGVDSDAPPLPERGPHELRIAIRAFNQMQERLRRFVDDRTQMVAAMSHDLKTPLTRLRLRAEFVEDHEQQWKMLADLDEMHAMVESTLAFARDDAQREPRMRVDLGALVEGVCENAVDTGGAVTFSVPRGIDVTCRPAAISRALANLVDNAIKYGGEARVSLGSEAGRVVICVDDNGPGIPPKEREKVFAPFYRLERSRNRETGGVGLGLSVARTVAREHGGDITLTDLDGPGLRVRMHLPILTRALPANTSAKNEVALGSAQ